jgi:hypothetical protein
MRSAGVMAAVRQTPMFHRKEARRARQVIFLPNWINILHQR